MRKNTWWVPVTSFALAVLLADVSGPKTRMQVRAEDAPTGGVTACVCDVYNLIGDIFVTPKLALVGVFYNFKHGIPATKTENTVGYTVKIQLKYKVQLADGVTVVTRPLEVEMKAKPPLWRKAEVDVVDTQYLDARFTVDMDVLDKAMRAAGAAVANPEKFLGEDLAARNPMVFKLAFHGNTKKVPGGLPNCSDDLTDTVAVPLTAGRGMKPFEKAQ